MSRPKFGTNTFAALERLRAFVAAGARPVASLTGGLAARLGRGLARAVRSLGAWLRPVVGRLARPLTKPLVAWLARARQHRQSAEEEARKRLLQAKPELVPMDWRNPPSENIAQAALPLGITAAGLAAAAYLVAQMSAQDQALALSVGAERVGASFDATPVGVAALTIGAGGDGVGPGSRLEEQLPPPFVPSGGGAPEVEGGGALALDGAGSTLSALHEDEFARGGGGGSDGGSSTAALDPSDGSSGGGGGGGGGSSTDPTNGFAPTGPKTAADLATDPTGRGAADLLAAPGDTAGPAGAAAFLALPNAAPGTAPVSAGTPPAPGFSLGGLFGAPEVPAGAGVPAFSTTAQPVRFVANAGQFADGVDFVADSGTYRTAVASDGLTVALPRAAGAGGADVVRLLWSDLNPDTAATGEGRLGSVSNYLLGSDPSKWHTGVAEYAAVRYAGAWDGIDLVYRQGAAGRVEYDLVVAPGANPGSAGFSVRGADARVDPAGRLVLTAPSGAELVHSAPVVYQTGADGIRQTVPGAFAVRADGSIGFSVGAYDPTRALVIDPLVEAYAVGVNGAGTSSYTAAAVDSSGNLFAAGWTTATSFPGTTLGYDSTLGGVRDAVVTKFDTAGAVSWSTYLGGTTSLPPLPLGFDQANGIALGSDGSIYVAGTTGANDFPGTTFKYQPGLGGGYDAFLAKLNSSGTALSWATYLGGTQDDYGNGIAVDSGGQAVVVGSTASNGSFPTASAHQSSFGGGATDAFVTRFNSAGTGVTFSTYLGSSSADAAYGVAQDATGNIFAVGQTASSGFVSTGGYDQTLGGSTDAFLTRFSSGGSLGASTLFGGTGDETAYAVAVDSTGRILLTGSTSSTNLPTVRPVQGSSGGGASDAFVARFTALSSAPEFATYQGSTGADAGYGIAADPDGRAVVVGAESGTLRVARYSPTGNVVEAVSGSVGTIGYAAATDRSGNMYAAGTDGTSAVALKYLPAPAAPTVTGFADDTGSSNSDKLTYDTTPTINGTATGSATVSVYRTSAATGLTTLLGTTTAAANGLWTYTLSTMSTDGTYALTAKQTVSGTDSARSTPVTFTLDTSGPEVAVSVASQTYDRRPPITVTALDLYGVASSATVALDVDLNNDSDFGDANETNFASATLVNGAYTFDSYTTLLTVGVTARVQARVLDVSGTQGTSAVKTVAVNTSPITWTATSATAAARGGYGAATGATAFDALMYAGDVTATQYLDLDRSPVPARGMGAALVYHSQEAAPAPVVQVTVRSDNAVAAPSSIVGTLTWDGSVAATVTYDVSALSPGADWVFGLAPTSGLTTGRHTYSLDLFVDNPGGATDISRTVTGSTFLVNRSSSPYGAGWSFSDTDALVTIASSGSYPAGVLRTFGTGGWSFYTDAGGGTYTSPAGDAGTLAAVGGGGWTYTGWDGQVLTFNSAGQETKWTSPDGASVVTYTYDASGGVATVASPDGGVATFAYSSSVLSTVTAPGGRTTTFTLSSGDLVTITDPASATHTFTYSAHRETGETYRGVNRLYTYSNGLAQTEKVGTDPVGTVVAALATGVGTAAVGGEVGIRGGYTAGSGAPWKTWYNAFGQPVQTLAPTGGITSFTRNNNGYVTGYTDPLGQATAYTVNGNGQITQVTRPDGSIATYTYGGANGALSGVVDARGGVWTVTNDAYGRPTSRTNPLNQTTTFGYDTGLLKTVTDALGQVVTYIYDSRRPAGALLGGAVTGTTGYDTAGNANTFTDALGNVTTRTYDTAGRVTALTSPLGNTTTSTYSAAGQLLSTTDPAGNVTSYAYDSAGRVEATIRAYGTSLAQRTTNVYDAVGNLVATVNALGQRTTSVFDAENHLVATVDALGNRTTTLYDLNGQVKATLDPLGRVTRFGYDSLGRRVTVTDALGNVATTVYDADSHVVATVDALGNRSTSVYDAVGQLIASVDALGNRTSYGYDAAGRQVTVTDPRGNVTTSVYDVRNRLEATVDALGKRATTVYDADDRVSATVDPLGNRTTLVYDNAGHLIATQDALGNFTTSVYDNAGRVSARVDALGNRTTSVYDELSRTIATVDALNNRSTSVYDAADRRIATVDQLGNRTTSVYDDAGRMTASVDALGNRATSVYDAGGNLIARVDALGRRTTFTLDGLNRVIATTDPLNAVSSVGYDAAGRQVTTTDALGNVTTSVYDNAGRMTEVIDALGNRTTSVFDGAGNRTVQIDARGYRTTSTYDALNRLVQTENARNQLSTVVYDDAGNTLATVDALGRRTTSVFDKLNRAEATIDALGQRTTSVFDAAGNRTAQIDALGRRTTFVYDELNRVKATVDALGGRATSTFDAAGNVRTTVDQLNRTTTFAYDARNMPVTRTDALGNVWTTAYDELGRAWRQIHPNGNDTRTYFDAAGRAAESADQLGNRRTTVFDAAGNPVASVDPLGNRTTSVFDKLNRVEATVDALSNRSTSVYDAAGNRTAVVDQLGNRTTAVFDELNRQIASVNALSNRTTVGYDAVGNVTTRTDALNKTTTLGYDALNRQTTEKDALGYVTTSVYDAVGNRTVLQDASGNRTTSVFDALNRVMTETNPQNVSGTFAYDAAGRKTSETDRLGRRRDFAYDDADQVLTEKWYAAGGSLSQTQTFTYDAVGQMLTAADPDGTYTLAYDAVGRVTRVDEPFSLVLTMGYDAAGNRTSVQDSKGGTATVVFDALNRQTSEQTAVSGGSAMRFDYAYTARSQVSSVTRYSDLAGTTVVGTTSYDYDAARRETHQQSTNGSGPVLANYTYTYDAADRLDTKVENGTTTTYGYDVTSQLTNDGATTFGYDATGNRTNTGYVTGTGNRMTSDGLWTWTYDNAGNVTKRSKGASSDTWEYTYDNRNQMVTAAYSATDGGTVTTRVTYTYDAWGNMIQRAAWDGSTTTTSREGIDQWDPAKPVPIGTENADAWADLDNSNVLTGRHIFGTQPDEVIARQTAAGTVTWDLADRQRSVKQLIDNSGAIVGTIAYSASGQVTSSSGITDGYGYTGQTLDAVTGFWVYNVRIYDPFSGRFLQADMVGFAAGDPNLFRYVKNNPTNATDPSGNEGLTDFVTGLTQHTDERTGETVWTHKSGREDLLDVRKWLQGTWVGRRVVNIGDGLLEVPLIIRDLGYTAYIGISGEYKEPGFTPSYYSMTAQAMDLAAASGDVEAQKAIYREYLLNMTIVYPVYKIGRDLVNGDSTSLEQTIGGMLFFRAVSGLGPQPVPRPIPPRPGGPTALLEQFPHLERLARFLGVEQESQFAGRPPVLRPEIPLPPRIIEMIPPHVLVAMRAGRVAEVLPQIPPFLRPLIPALLPMLGLDLQPQPQPDPQRPNPAPATEEEAEHKKSCFAAGTPLRVPGGWRNIEELVVGDLVLARDEYNPYGDVFAKAVEEVFVTKGLVWHLHAGGQVIRTTAEHPFWVWGRGWVPCNQLKVGDWLFTLDGWCVQVEDLLDTGEYETLYNIRVADFHTYFVGCDEWGFSVWAHNICVYRGLSEWDWVTLHMGLGISARVPGAGNSIASHVAGQIRSQWISTSKSEIVAHLIFGQHGVAVIDLDKVPSFWLDISGGIPGQPPFSMISNWARAMLEVVILDHIPQGAIEEIRQW